MLKGTSLLRDLLADADRSVETVLADWRQGHHKDTDSITAGLVEELCERAHCSTPELGVTATARRQSQTSEQDHGELELRFRVASDDRGQSSSPVSTLRLHPIRLDAYATAKQRVPATCDRLLHRSPASFLLVYTKDGMKTVPVAAVARTIDAPEDLGPDPLAQFYYRDLRFTLFDFYRGYMGGTRMGTTEEPTEQQIEGGGVSFLADISVSPTEPEPEETTDSNAAQLQLDQF